MFGPTGVGVLYGKRELLNAMPPWQGGGNVIEEVTFEHTTYRKAPARFEAGTGMLASVVGLGAAVDYLEDLGMDNIRRYEQELLAHATEALGGIAGLRLIGTAVEKVAVLSFVLEGVRTEDMGRFLDREGVAVRAGRHCAHPAMRRFGVPGTVRPSLAFYNTHAEIDIMAAAIVKAKART
jgi:cysteine desulfurase/selenocysteine lyase